MGYLGYGGGAGGGFGGGTAIPPLAGGGLMMMPGGAPPAMGTTAPGTTGYGLPPGAMMPSQNPMATPGWQQTFGGGGGMGLPPGFQRPQPMQASGSPAVGMGGSSIGNFLMSPQGQQLMRMLMMRGQGGAPTGGMM